MTMTNIETEISPEELEAMQEVIDDIGFFAAIDEIACELENLTADELQRVSDFVYELQLERDN